MAGLELLAAVVVMALAAEAGIMSAKETKCDFPDIDLDDEVDKLLEKLPAAYLPMEARGFRPSLPGLEVGDQNTTGLNEIKRYGPVVTYCKNGESMVQVDLINIGDVELNVPLRSCSGQEVKAILHAEFSRFTAQFLVDKDGSSGKYLALSGRSGTLPVTTYNVEFILDGLGPGGRIASVALSKLVPQLFQEAWTASFFPTFRGALRKALQENNEVF